MEGAPSAGRSTHLSAVQLQGLEGVEGDEDVPHIGLAARRESREPSAPPPRPPAPAPGRTHVDLLPQEPLPQPLQQRRLVQLRQRRQVPHRAGRRLRLPGRHHAAPRSPEPSRLGSSLPAAATAPPRGRPVRRGRHLNAGRRPRGWGR